MFVAFIDTGFGIKIPRQKKQNKNSIKFTWKLAKNGQKIGNWSYPFRFYFSCIFNFFFLWRLDEKYLLVVILLQHSTCHILQNSYWMVQMLRGLLIGYSQTIWENLQVSISSFNFSSIFLKYSILYVNTLFLPENCQLSF